MIITEKQILRLMAYANQLFHTPYYEYRENIAILLDEINMQQSDKLQEIK